ncbi:sensor histidine kinase [Cohaesibacter celericrescens]|uniref:sensor histidine kinase n=1 Tax=Cohaesibacter celericrescens TaxID=2067669 RepID=UPI003565019D
MPYYINDGKLEENLLPFLMESVHQGISVIDKDLNMVFINRAACKMLDLPISVIKKNPSLQAIFRFNAERGDYGTGDIEEQVAERMDLTRRFIAHEIERERPDGRIIRIQGNPIGEAGFVTIYTDVTEQRTYEANLEAIQYELELKLENSVREVRYNRDLLVNAINAIDDGLIVFDEHNNLVLANIRMQKLYPSLRRHLARNSHISKIEGFQVPCSTEEYDNNGKKRFSKESKLHDDCWYRIEQSATVNGGKIITYSDISAYKEQTGKLQEHTNQLVKLLQKEINLSDTQREFVSMASHEFKTPLAIIDSNAQRIQRRIDTMPKERLAERVSNIRDSVERMQYLINRFMDFSSDEIAGIKVEAKTQKFRSTLEKLCHLHLEMQDHTVMEWNLDALPDLASFDQNLLDQCLSNILSNAIKYSDQNAPIHVVGKRDKRYLKIEVHDQGVGIPKPELSKIFNKYYRASTSSGIAGTGIGLNFTQMALKEQGGHIEVESVVGEGSCFTIFLPASIAIDTAQTEKASESLTQLSKSTEKIAS